MPASRLEIHARRSRLRLTLIALGLASLTLLAALLSASGAGAQDLQEKADAKRAELG